MIVVRLKLILLLVIFNVAIGCKIRIDTPSGGEITTLSGAYSCGPEQSCEVDIYDLFFEETFVAVPREGYVFHKWKKKNRSFCATGKARFEKQCSIVSAPMAASQELMKILESNAEFYLEPIFVREGSNDTSGGTGNSGGSVSSGGGPITGGYRLPSIGPLAQTTPTYNRPIIIDGRPGDREEIGLFTEWQSEFLATGRNKDLIIAQADSALNYPWCDYDQMTSKSWQGGEYAFSFDHTPNLFFLPYLLTGDTKYVAPMECQYKILQEWPWRSRGATVIPAPEDRTMYFLSGRGFAWQLRNLAELAYIQKQGDTKETFYIDSLELARTSAEERMTRPIESVFHVLGENQLANTHQWTGWMEGFIGMAVNHAIDLGFTEWLPIARWHFKHLKKRCGGKWPLKACDNDHVTFSQEQGNTWENAKPYNSARLSCYESAPANQLMSYRCGAVFMTYADRAQISRGWAAMAAANGIAGAAELYERLDLQIHSRGGDDWFKYNMVYPRVNTPALEAGALVNIVENTQNAPNQPRAPSGPSVLAANPAAILGAAPGSWVEIPNTKLADVLPPESFQQPIRYIVGPSAITGAWNGAVFNTHLQRLDIFASGGHADYCGNEYLGFSMNTLSWELLDGPSDLTNFDLKSGKVNNGTIDQEGSAPDGKPLSRHTYGGQVYHPGLKRSFMFGGALCGGAGTADDRWWSVTPNGNYTKLGGSGAWTPLGYSAQYDPGTDNIFLTLAGNITEYVPSTNTKITRTNNPSGNWGQVAAIDSTRNNLFVFGHDSGNGASTARVFNTIEKTQTTVTLSGDLSILGRPGIGLKYVPELDVFAAWIEGSDLYIIDPETFYISRYQTSGVPPDGSSKNGIYGRFAYSAQYGGFIVVADTSENVFFLKLPNKSAI